MDEMGLDRVRKRMSKIDAMPKDIRELVHEHGLTMVQAFMDCGVTKAKHIKHLITTVQRGSYEIGDRTDNPSQLKEGWSYK
jgi:hypothetical protein